VKSGNNLQDLFLEEMVAILPRLWRFAVSLSRQKLLAEDLVQQTCERALERREQFNLGSRLDHWMFAIMASLWKNYLRSERVRRGNGFVSSEDVIEDSQFAQIENSLLRSQLHRAVLELPLWQREAVLLVYVEDMSYKDAAHTLNLPLGTIMSRLAAAKLTLAAKLNPNGDNSFNKWSYHG
jgi:RNA polymerase sigma-70 factor, ECF subfamily